MSASPMTSRPPVIVEASDAYIPRVLDEVVDAAGRQPKGAEAVLLLRLFFGGASGLSGQFWSGSRRAESSTGCFALQSRRNSARGTFLVRVRWWSPWWSLKLHRPGRISSRRAKHLNAYIARLIQ